MLSKNTKRNVRLLGGVAAGGTLGYIFGNVPGLIAGAKVGYHLANR